MEFDVKEELNLYLNENVKEPTRFPNIIVEEVNAKTKTDDGPVRVSSLSHVWIGVDPACYPSTVKKERSSLLCETSLT
ncbi:hypothetical protein Goarm_021982, partial [Gossypium armourianum]|nr:hypothetical protein [Gossypium armourianum]